MQTSVDDFRSIVAEPDSRDECIVLLNETPRRVTE